MYTKTAAYYDQIYSFKDYGEEAAQIAAIIRNHHPAAKTLLDIGCATGEHIKHLAERYAADGLDLDPRLIDVARKKIPGSVFTVADMRSFTLSRHYDVVQCLFSAIGYLTKPDDVIQALRQFDSHLNPDGIVLVEPWFTPGSWEAGKTYLKSYETDDSKICRMSFSEKEGFISKLYFHYMIGNSMGVEYLREEHSLALYTIEEMKTFFEAAGMAVQYDPLGIFDRGLYVARRKAA